MWSLVSRGEVKSISIGRRRLVPRQEITALIERRLEDWKSLANS
jgi:hypothetical protein